MAEAIWINEKKPGEAWLYNEPALKYNDITFDTFVVYYNSLGVATVWTNEDK